VHLVEDGEGDTVARLGDYQRVAVERDIPRSGLVEVYPGGIDFVPQGSRVGVEDEGDLGTAAGGLERVKRHRVSRQLHLRDVPTLAEVRWRQGEGAPERARVGVVEIQVGVRGDGGAVAVQGYDAAEARCPALDRIRHGAQEGSMDVVQANAGHRLRHEGSRADQDSPVGNRGVGGDGELRGRVDAAGQLLRVDIVEEYLAA
jgi:hypothetical protein